MGDHMKFHIVGMDAKRRFPGDPLSPWDVSMTGPCFTKLKINGIEVEGNISIAANFSCVEGDKLCNELANKDVEIEVIE